MTPHQQITAEMIRKFPDAQTRTLALMLYREYPQMFASVETARNHVRRLRGAFGEDSRKEMKTKEFARPIGKPGDPFAKLPSAKKHFEDWGAVQYDGELRCLVLSDIHIPYHDPAALRPALEHGKKQEINSLLLNGDTADFFSVSFWEKDPRERNFAEELKSVRQFLETVREAFPKAKIIFKPGNHEERFERYMSVKAPELLGVPDFEMRSILGLDKLGIDYIPQRRPVRLGKLNVIHGHEYRFSISNPVNPARGFFLRAKTHCLGGHLHQSSQHSEKNLEGKVISTWSTGCLCDLHPDYSVLNNWSHGFAFVETTADGTFEVTNHRIINGKIY